MKEIEGSSKFWLAGDCKSLKEAISLLSEISGEEASNAITAFAMVIVANSTEGGEYRDGALKVLDALAFAKAELDSARCHTYPAVEVTSDIFSSVQKYADENTIPCTEWPTSSEIVSNVLTTALKYSEIREWKKFVRDKIGAIVGEERI